MVRQHPALLATACVSAQVPAWRCKQWQRAGRGNALWALRMLQGSTRAVTLSMPCAHLSVWVTRTHIPPPMTLPLLREFCMLQRGVHPQPIQRNSRLGCVHPQLVVPSLRCQGLHQYARSVRSQRHEFQTNSSKPQGGGASTGNRASHDLNARRQWECNHDMCVS